VPPAIAAGLALLTATAPVAATDTTVEVEASTVWASPVTDGVPRGLLAIGNPSLICLFVPEACPPEMADLLLLLSDPMGVLVDPNAEPEPVQPAIPPGTVAVALANGNVRYEAALSFDFPSIPADHQVDEFTLVLQQEQPTYSYSSPMFRAAVDAMSAVVGDPEGAMAALPEAFAENPTDDKMLDVRACPLLVPFEPTESPQVQSSRDFPEDEFGAREVSCAHGAFGEFDPDEGTWSFDLTWAASAWANGTLPFHGIYLEPVVANFAGFGDEDPSTNAQVTFAADEVGLTVRTSQAPNVGGFTPEPETRTEEAFDGGTEEFDSTGGSFVPVAPPPASAEPIQGEETAEEPEVAAPPRDGGAAPPPAAMTPVAVEQIPEAWRLSAVLLLIVVGAGTLAATYRRPQPTPVDMGSLLAAGP
jgi:hypothetical protein